MCLLFSFKMQAIDISTGIHNPDYQIYTHNNIQINLEATYS